MIQKYKKRWMTILILVLICLIINMPEYILVGEGIELRTFLQVGKGIFLWLIVPVVCAWLLYGICRKEWKDRKGISIICTVLLVIAFILILVTGLFRGAYYVFSTQCKDEKKLEGNILEIKESDWDSTTTSYYETVLFFFRKPFAGYDEETLLHKVTEKYGADVVCMGAGDGLYQFSGIIRNPVEETFTFQVKNDYPLTTNYGEELKYVLGDAFFREKNRSHSWKTTDTEVGAFYLLLVECNGRADLEWFCSDITEIMEYYLQNEYLQEHTELIDELGVQMNQEQNIFYIGSYLDSDDMTGLYNYLYENMEKWLNEDYDAGLAMNDNSGNKTEDGTMQESTEVTQEQKDYLLSLEPACTFVTENGLEYRVLETDRACGSSYYQLIATADHGKTCALVNRDPFLGNGGGARWITFLDNQLGFVGMCYSGGSLGMLFRTEDGGKSFKEIEYPSPQIELPDGTYYNPFVMPERIYEEGGALYLECGQGPDGDYKGGDTKCMGLYESTDQGRTWVYVREIISKEE